MQARANFVQILSCSVMTCWVALQPQRRSRKQSAPWRKTATYLPPTTPRLTFKKQINTQA